MSRVVRSLTSTSASVTGLKVIDAFEGGGGHAAETGRREILQHGREVGPPAVSDQRMGLRREPQDPVGPGVGRRFDAEAVAHQEPFLPVIVQMKKANIPFQLT
jgi:hypothetical protein